MSGMLLDLLHARVGETIRKVSPRQGGEYHSPCPSCGGNDRFICFPEQTGGDVAQRHGLTGTWSCPRHCQTGGDIISFLTTFEGLSFGDACKQLGIDSSQEFRRYRPLRQPGRQSSGSTEFAPRAYAAPTAQWTEQATKLATKAHARLLETPNVLGWLARRGLPLEAVQAYGLGYIEGEGGDGTCIFRSRESFGLHTILKENGKPKKLRIPRGVTIPAWAPDGGVGGQCLRIRIRKRNADIAPNNPKDSKYLLVPQSSAPYSAPLMLPPVGVTPELATWVVVEAELDAMAVHYACGGRVGALSVLTVAGRPDTTAHATLSRAARILVALDFDSRISAEGCDKKPMPAAQAWPWWASTYEQARLWPVPEGKDPGDAFALGVDLRAWIMAGAPAVPVAQNTKSCGISVAHSANFDQSPPETGHLGASICGLPAAGGRDGDFSAGADSSARPQWVSSPVPSYGIPADVLELARMWQGLPVRIRWLPDANGRHRAMKPEYDSVRGRDRQRVDAFLRRIWTSQQVWEWLAANENDVVTAENYFFVRG